MKRYVVFLVIVFFAVLFILPYQYPGNVMNLSLYTINETVTSIRSHTTSLADNSTLLTINTSTSPFHIIPISLNEDISKYAKTDLQKDYNTSKMKSTKKFILERSMCTDKHENNVDITALWKNRCPDKPIVTVKQLGRLGNQMWEYASVWTVAKSTNREAFVPSCIINRLKSVFKNLTKIPPLKYIEDCPKSYQQLIERQMNIDSTMGI